MHARAAEQNIVSIKVGTARGGTANLTQNKSESAFACHYCTSLQIQPSHLMFQINNCSKNNIFLKYIAAHL